MANNEQALGVPPLVLILRLLLVVDIQLGEETGRLGVWGTQELGKLWQEKKRERGWMGKRAEEGVKKACCLVR